MYPFQYVIIQIYAVVCLTGIAAKPPYGDSRSFDYKYYDASGSGQYMPRNMPSYTYYRAPAAADYYPRYRPRDEYTPRENPYRRYRAYDDYSYGRRFDHNEYNDRPYGYNYDRHDYEDDYPTPPPTPATSSPATPKPIPQKNNINAETLTVKEIRLGPWIIRNEEYDDSNHLVILDSTNDNDNRIMIDSDGTLHVNELPINTDWSLRQKQGSLIVKNVNNANDQLKLSAGMGPWTLDSSRTMDLNTISVGPEKKWVIRQEPPESPGALMIRDVSGGDGSDNRAAFYPGLGTCFTFDETCELALNGMNLSSRAAPDSVIRQTATFNGEFAVSRHVWVPTELGPTTTTLLSIDDDGEMLVKGMKVGDQSNWAIRVDPNSSLVLQDLSPGSGANNRAVYRRSSAGHI